MRARWNAMMLSKPTIYDSQVFMSYFKISIFGHVTDDVIIWSRDQIWEFFLDQNFWGHNLGKVSEN